MRQLRVLVLVLVGVFGLTGVLTLLGRKLLRVSELGVDDPRRGREVFFGRGLCSGCHKYHGEGAGVRAPAFSDDLVRLAASRVENLDALDYLVQALYEPSAFVVSGFPEGLMPEVDRPPLRLSDDDVIAVILFLWGEAERPSPTSVRDAIRRIRVINPETSAVPVGDVERGRATWNRLGCGSCHGLGGMPEPKGESLGPDLTAIGRYQGADYLVRSIREPDAVRVPGTWSDGRPWRMPVYENLTDLEVSDLVALLLLR